MKVAKKALKGYVAKIGRKKSVWPDGVPGEILKLGGEAMTPYLARLLEIPLVLPSQVTGKSHSCSYLQSG
jgi:hypothetical protein